MRFLCQLNIFLSVIKLFNMICKNFITPPKKTKTFKCDLKENRKKEKESGQNGTETVICVPET